MTGITNTNENYLTLSDIWNYFSESDTLLLSGEAHAGSRFNETPLIGNQTPSITKDFTAQNIGTTETIKILFSRAKTLQPLFVACKIVGMCGYKLYKKSDNQKKLTKILNQNKIFPNLIESKNTLISAKERVLAIYKSQLKNELTKPVKNQATIKEILHEIGSTKKTIAELKTDIERFQATKKFNETELPRLKLALQSTWISLAELFALGFAHPGSNVWKSCTDLSSRVCSLCSRLNASSKQSFFNRPCIKDSIANIAIIAAASIAITGTALSVLKHAGLIHGKDKCSEGILLLSCGIQIVETGIMLKNYVQVRINKTTAP